MTKLSLKLLAAAVIAAALLIAAGCGGDDEPTLTKDEYIAQADEICATANTELEAEAKELGNEPPPADVQEEFISTNLADNYEQQLADLRELNPPEADQEELDKMYSALEDLIQEARDDPAGLLARTEAPEASTLAAEYGLTDCGN